MRKITNKATRAFFNSEAFRENNTEVVVLQNTTILKLFGNEIAYRYNDPQRTLTITNKGYFTKTTLERLRGIGANITVKKGIWFVDGKEWDGRRIDIKEKI
jgi:hypothetical protein